MRAARVIRHEILDDLPYEEARRSLQDLVRLNRSWGGHAALRWLMAQAAAPGETFSLLDVGAASGDMGAAIRRSYPGARVTSLDYRASHLCAAPPPKVVADAFQLPVAPAAYDFVFCSLFLHHFENEQIVELLSSFRTAARRAVLVIDLERNWIARNFVPWTRWLLGWDPVTAHDAPISVDAGFTPAELTALARAAGLAQVRARAFRPGFRIALIGKTATP
jgi:2-polyprenyl-3-methyl-5-hydroxy-6-metoxy-1,4-benzoquinol methylase